MECVICRHGETAPGAATVTLIRDETTLVVKDVPALVCDNCGEEYLEAETTDRLLKTTECDVRAGVQISVRSYVLA